MFYFIVLDGDWYDGLLNKFEEASYCAIKKKVDILLVKSNYFHEYYIKG